MIPPTVPEELGFAPIGRSELISVDLRREGRPPRSGGTAGLASPQHPRWRRRMATRAHRRRSPTPILPGWAGEPDRASSATASDTGAVVAFEDNVLSNSDFLIDRSTTASNGTYVAGDLDFDVYAAGGLNVVRVEHHPPRLRPVLLLEVVHGLTRRLSGRPGPEARRRRLRAARLPGHRLRQEPNLQVRRAVHPGAPAPGGSTSTARPGPAIGPWNAGAY